MVHEQRAASRGERFHATSSPSSRLFGIVVLGLMVAIFPNRGVALHIRLWNHGIMVLMTLLDAPKALQEKKVA